MAVNGKNVLVFYSNTDSHGKKDATYAFVPEALAFAKTHNVPSENVFGIKCPKVKRNKRRKPVLDAIMAQKNIEAIAFFGHGWPDGIQFGFTRSDISLLVNTMKGRCKSGVKVILFACLAAENDVRDSNVTKLGPGTDGGFADLLRDEMVRQGMRYGWVDAHKTAGHTSWNPFVVRFYCKNVDDPKVGAVGGSWLVQPRSQFWRKWIKALKNKKTKLRWLFPFMEELELKATLDGKKIVKVDF